MEWLLPLLILGALWMLAAIIRENSKPPK